MADNEKKYYDQPLHYEGRLTATVLALFCDVRPLHIHGNGL